MSRLYANIEIHPEQFESFIPHIHTYSTVTSTNDVARDLIHRESVGEGTVVVAERQTQGRGRYDREWASPPGGLYLSIVLRPRLAVERAPLLGMLCAVAAARTIRQISHANAVLKWPNDILLHDRKLGGILSELVLSPEPLGIIGVGLNINTSPHDLPPSLQQTSISLFSVTGCTLPLSEALLVLLKHIDKLLVEVDANNSYAKILSAWRETNATIGRRVVVTGHSVVRGRAVNITTEGWLVVKTDDGSEVTVAEGDVQHLSIVS